MPETLTYSGPERRARDRSFGIQLRRREQQDVKNDRRRATRESFDIAAALEMHLDRCKTRRAMIRLLEQWRSEAQSAAEHEQDPDYIDAVERAIEVLNQEPDVETAIAVLQRQ